jgi:site-specific recombinase XerC
MASAPESPQVSHYANSQRPARTLTRAEKARLLKVTGAKSSDYADHILFALALGTGLREHELAALDMSDLFNVRGGARCRVPLRTFKRSPGNEAIQEVFLNTALRGKLGHYRDWKRKRGFDVSPDAPVFCVRGGARMSTRRIRERLPIWREPADIPQIATFHWLRHTALQQIYEDSGGDIRLVQRAARHVTLTSTQIYVHASADAVAAAMEQLDV